MCRVKIKNEIVSEQDVQNLITAIVLRQEGRYTRKYLLIATKQFLPDPVVRVVVDDRQIKSMIDDTLSIFHRNGRVRYQANFCYPVFPGINRALWSSNN